MKKKLIEVALPLEAINKESAREKSIRHGHPSTLHLWWARRPLAACRAVLFASLVDDPSSHPDKFPTEEAQEQERQRLFDIIGKIITVEKKGKTEQIVKGLVSWDDLNNPEVIEAAQREIARSIAWNRGEEPPKSTEEIRAYLQKYAPPVYDPFCGGGSIPLEAQRLGLEAHGSDLNPVAVLITKALIEIPPKFKDKPPVNPEAQKKLKTARWYGAQGLAEDVRYYGQWMRDEAFKRIGHLYPKVTLPQEYGGGEATVIAWLWARTVKCPNPACGAQMPLVRSFALSTKKGKEAWVEPVIDRVQEAPVVRFEVRTGKGKVPDGTMNRRGSVCICCKTPVSFDYIRNEGKAGQMNAQLMAIVAEGERQRVYVSPNDKHLETATSAQPDWKPEAPLPDNTRDIRPQLYGMPTYGDLFSSRQLLALTTFSNLVSEVREQVKYNANDARILDDNLLLCKGGVGATAYADAVATYLAFAIDKAADYWSVICSWHTSGEKMRNTFARQAIPMTWDYAECCPFSDSTGNWMACVDWIWKVIAITNCQIQGIVNQRDATLLDCTIKPKISTDPPYYDNIGYADLSDFFYVWLRRSIGELHPDICSTLLVPKEPELVATPHRFGGEQQKAKEFFEIGLGKAFTRMRETGNSDYPLTVYYAFKQSESEDDEDNKNVNAVIASTGWETMLEGLIKAGFTITGTLPIRTELSNRTVASGSNALASSIVLVCRPRPETAPSATRRQFLTELKRELPEALKNLQQGNIAPVDLAQASIGPGMAIFSRYTQVLDADGSPMRIRTALQLINQMLDEFLTEQEGEFDADTRWALTWFEQNQFNEGLYGDAETLSKAKNTSVQGLVNGGILTAKSGKVRLLRRDELPDNWNPTTHTRTSDWETTQHLIRTLDQKGETSAATMLSQLGDRGERARDLAYRLYNICDRKSWTQEAIAYNSLVISWAEISRLATETKPESVQGELF
jgi:putative DNA methylase